VNWSGRFFTFVRRLHVVVLASASHNALPTPIPFVRKAVDADLRYHAQSHPRRLVLRQEAFASSVQSRHSYLQSAINLENPP
jgi:hypothetical protein